MIKYDYTIKRNEEDEIREYKPHLIPKELSELVYIQGPNSSGKSTLLNLVALGFFAEKLKDDELNPALREKIEELRNLKYQQLTFEIEIQNEKIGKTIRSTKSDFTTKDFKVVEIIGGKEKILSTTEFLKEYKLIYDIPSDPIRRLQELLKELKNSQINVEFEVTHLRKKINDAINGIIEGKNPEHLKQLGEDIEKLKNTKKQLEIEINSEQGTLDWLKIFLSTKCYLYYQSQNDQLKVQLEEARKAQSGVQKKEQRLSKKQSEILDEFKAQAALAEDLYDKITVLLDLIVPTNQRHRVNIWKSLECGEEMKYPSLHRELKQETRFFITLLRKIEQDDDDALISESRFLKAFLELLKNFRYANISIPGTGKKIDEVLGELENVIKEKESRINECENINECISKLEKFRLLLDEALTDEHKLKELREKHREALELMNDDTESGVINKLSEKLSQSENKMNYYSKELEVYKIDPSDAQKHLKNSENSPQYDHFKGHSETQLFDRIDNGLSEIIAKQDEIKRIDKKLEIAIDEKKRIERREPHKYHKYLKKLEGIKKVVMELESKFSIKFQDNIKKIISGVDLLKFTPDQKKYADNVATFLAAKVRFIKHIDKTYEIEKMDTVSKEIWTSSGKKIRFTDLGTGQGQGAYLGGLLSMNDNRKIIALFDEVAMMDTSTLEPIFNKLKELNNKKRLLLAIIVQRCDDTVKIQSLI